MDESKLISNNKNPRFINRTKRAYRPEKPYCSVEGAHSSAWNKLSVHAVWVLMEFYKRFDGYNRHCLTLSYRDVKEKMSTNTFSKSIWELRCFGFIDVIRYGSLQRNNSIYALSKDWKHKSKNSSKLDRIERLLRQAEKVKHINTPKHSDEKHKTEFRLKRKQLLWKIRKKALRG